MSPGTLTWKARQSSMLAWYQQLLVDPKAAGACLLQDYEPLGPVLAQYDGSILDMGGGLGLARPFLPARAVYTVADPVAAWAELAARGLPEGFPVAGSLERFVVTTGEQLPFPDETFDAVLALWSLNHVQDPSRVIAESGRVLKRGGRFLVVLEDLEPADADAGRPGDGVVSRVVATPQDDHIVFDEASLLSWAHSDFVPARRWWSGRYLALEFVREAGRTNVPVEPRVNMGDLRKTQPVTRGFGYERGQPVDRYYIERFLASQAAHIRGRVLEIGDDTYTTRYGRTRVSRAEVLSLHPDSDRLGYHGDLSSTVVLPGGAFDCVVCTQTLQLIYDVHTAVAQLHRALAPGGVLLATIPGLSQIDDPGWMESWYWAFTQHSARRLFGDIFGQDTVTVTVHGNVLAAVAFLEGLCAEDLTQDELDVVDPAYPLLLTVRAVKRGD